MTCWFYFLPRIAVLTSGIGGVGGWLFRLLDVFNSLTIISYFLTLFHECYAQRWVQFPCWWDSLLWIPNWFSFSVYSWSWRGRIFFTEEQNTHASPSEEQFSVFIQPCVREETWVHKSIESWDSGSSILDWCHSQHQSRFMGSFLRWNEVSEGW